MLYHLSPKSSNSKTGPIPVSTTSSDSCPPTCPFIDKGCYAKGGPLSLHWRKVTTGKNPNVTDIDGFCEKIEKLPENQLWRHDQAGDLPGKGNDIDTDSLDKLVRANKGKRGFTYTHKELNEKNSRAIAEANEAGFTINLSANTLDQADEYLARGIAPVVVVVDENAPAKSLTPKGNKLAVCPAQVYDKRFGPQKKNISCATCGLCQVRDRKVIVGFRAHGGQRKRVNKIVGR